MDHVALPQYFDLYLEGSCWKMLWREDVLNANGLQDSHSFEPVVLGPATGPSGITETEAHRTAWKQLLSVMQQNELANQSKMTVAGFVEKIFVPEHVALKMPSSQTHYQRMLRHVLTPAEVDRAFRHEPKSSNKGLEAASDWPYLSDLRLCDVRPEDVRRVIAAALARGYSAHTVKHIRNVMSAIFSYAKQGQCVRDNPVSQVRLTEVLHKEADALTLAQAKDALRLMKHPEKELMLIAVLSDISMSEICGLQWSRVNLTEAELHTGGELLPPRTVAIRKQWYRDKLESLKDSRIRNLPIPEALLPILVKLRSRADFTGPDDFVFVSRQGTPVNQNNIVERRLKPLAKQLGVPALSWQIFRRTRKALLSEFGKQSTDWMSTIVPSLYPSDQSEPSRNAPFKRAWPAVDSSNDRRTWGGGSSLPSRGATANGKSEKVYPEAESPSRRGQQGVATFNGIQKYAGSLVLP